jgi:hypothetical protein
MKMKYSDFPIVFNKHVVIDTRTKATYHIEAASAVGALAQHITSLGETEFNRLPEADRSEIADITMNEAMSLIGGRLLGMATTDSLFDVIKAGPFQVTGGDISRKNVNFCLVKFAEIVAEGRAPTEEEKLAGKWMSDHFEASRVRREAVKEEGEMTVEAMMAKIFRGAPRF